MYKLLFHPTRAETFGRRDSDFYHSVGKTFDCVDTQLDSGK